jgi:hypothetical protein
MWKWVFLVMFNGKYQINGSDVTLIASLLLIATDEVAIPDYRCYGIRGLRMTSRTCSSGVSTPYYYQYCQFSAMSEGFFRELLTIKNRLGNTFVQQSFIKKYRDHTHLPIITIGRGCPECTGVYKWKSLAVGS